MPIFLTLMLAQARQETTVNFTVNFSINKKGFFSANREVDSQIIWNPVTKEQHVLS